MAKRYKANQGPTDVLPVQRFLRCGIIVQSGWSVICRGASIRRFFSVSVLLIAAAAPHIINAGGSRQRVGDFLYDNASAAIEDFKGCSDDPLHISDNKTLRAAENTIGANKVPITFEGCKVGDFAVEQSGATEASAEYTVYYPILSVNSIDSYVAPITHELVHIRQLIAVGDRATLLRVLTIKQVELEADFITGITFQRLGTLTNQSEFQENLQLVGMYLDKRGNEHGSPEQRTSAFRQGYHLHEHSPEHDSESIDVLRQFFQDEVYGNVVRN